MFGRWHKDQPLSSVFSARRHPFPLGCRVVNDDVSFSLLCLPSLGPTRTLRREQSVGMFRLNFSSGKEIPGAVRVRHQLCVKGQEMNPILMRRAA